MDLTHPIRAIVPTLEGPVLEVLARTKRPLTGLEVHRLAGAGSPNGVRLALGRLALQGIVHAEHRAAAVFYVGNRQHLAWPAVEELAGLRGTLLERLRRQIAAWPVPAVHVSIFGSVARGEGDEASDVDILVVRPEGSAEDESPWADQLDELREDVRRWTGNACQTFEIDRSRLMEHVRAGDPLVEEWLRDGITVAGPRAETLVHVPLSPDRRR